MKHINSVIILSGIMAMAFYSCRNNVIQESQRSADTSYTICYLNHIVGTNTSNLISDSLIIQLNIKGDSVTGTLKWLPSEKDKMIGVLNGTVKDHIVTAIYTYQAEGITAKERKIFKMESDKLLIKGGDLEEVDGIWQLKNEDAAAYTQNVSKVECW